MASMPESVGFVGGGRIVRCFLGGWKHSGDRPRRILVSDPDRAAVEKLRAVEPTVAEVSLETACRASMVILAVHPPVLRTVVESIGTHLHPSSAVLSLAPVITLEDLTRSLGTVRVARAIPNAPSLAGLGFNPVAFAPSYPKEERQAVLSLLAQLGECQEVDEETLEVWAILTGMGPTYLWPLLQALRECGRSLGVDPVDVDRGLWAMASGAASLLLRSGLSEEDVLDLIPAKPLDTLIQPVAAEIPKRLEAIYRKLHPAQ